MAHATTTLTLRPHPSAAAATAAAAAKRTIHHAGGAAAAMLASCARKLEGHSTLVPPSSTSRPPLALRENSAAARISLRVTPPMTKTISRRPPATEEPAPPSPRPYSQHDTTRQNKSRECVWGGEGVFVWVCVCVCVCFRVRECVCREGGVMSVPSACP